MRICGGEYKGRQLQVPKGKDVRPTSDKVRQAIFNSLLQYGLPQDAQVLDMFCGTGALGLEALSRGAQFCTFIDKDKNSLRCTKNNIEALEASAKSKMLNKDSTKLGDIALNYIPANLVFLDPPYRKNLILPSLMNAVKKGWIASDALCVIEAELNSDIFVPDVFSMVKRKKYGDTQIVICRYGSSALSNAPA